MTVDGFDDFCLSILRRPTWPGDLSPTELAREFVGHFGLTGFPRYQHLVGLLRGAGVQHVVHATRSKGIRGAHYGLRGGTLHHPSQGRRLGRGMGAHPTT